MCPRGTGRRLYDTLERSPELHYPYTNANLRKLDAAVNQTSICRFNDLKTVEAAFTSRPDSITVLFVEPIAHNASGIIPELCFLEGL